MFFDVGGTLLQPWPSVGAIYSRVGQRHGIVANETVMEQAFHNSWKAMKTKAGSLTIAEKQWWRELVLHTIESLGVVADDCRREAYFEELYQTFTRAEAWQVFP